MTLPDLWILPISPTRFLIERFPDPKPIRLWNWIFRTVLALWLVVLWFQGTGEAVRQWPLHIGWIALWFLPFSRVNELALGFYKDAIQRYTGPPSRTHFTPV